MLHDDFSAELEHKINTASTYGKDLLSISARQTDALSDLGDTLAQRIRTPELNISGACTAFTRSARDSSPFSP